MATFVRQNAFYYIVLALLYTLHEAASFPEQGIWDFVLSPSIPAVNITKSLYKNSTVKVTVQLCQLEENNDAFIKFSSSRVYCSLNYRGLYYVNTSFESFAGEDINCVDHSKMSVIDEDGIILISLTSSSTKSYNISVRVQMQGNSGYLSAIDWPLLPFYSTMCVVYALYGFFWMIICFCYWRDILRIQLWIGAVIFLGLVEKAVFVAEYESINKSGRSVEGAVIAAELVSCFKRTLARMLVIIVSLGFGITKPRLGSALHKVTALGCTYFILSLVEAVFRVFLNKTNMSRSIMIAIIPLAITEALICWWIFSSLVQTIRTLILKKNLVKLSLYRHFRNTLILAVLASVIYAIWSMKTYRMATCITKWKDLWVDEAFWHILFSLILLVIIILWRPSANNQRYAYSLLQDAEEAEEDLVYDAIGDIKKMRNVKGQQHGRQMDKEDENLKWVEENIPTTLLDIDLPGLLDSEMELNQHKVQLSKME